jgi:hypothetical protein
MCLKVNLLLDMRVICMLNKSPKLRRILNTKYKQNVINGITLTKADM